MIVLMCTGEILLMQSFIMFLSKNLVSYYLLKKRILTYIKLKKQRYIVGL